MLLRLQKFLSFDSGSKLKSQLAFHLYSMRLTVFVIQIDCLSDSFLVDDKNLCLVCLDLPDHLMHKNQLQEHTQKLGLPAPVYRSTNEGFPHAPKFRSAVLVDGKEYVSKLMFSHKKEAEQEVAKYAFDCIMRRIKDERCKLIHQVCVWFLIKPRYQFNFIGFRGEPICTMIDLSWGTALESSVLCFATFTLLSLVALYLIRTFPLRRHSVLRPRLLI